jgi:hypothetical protein
MGKPTTNTPENFRQRDHRFSALPLKDVLKIQMKNLGIKNVDLQKILGYPAANVVSMIRNGSMRLPEGKAIEVADALQLDRTFVLGKVISENNAELWNAITTVLGDRLVSASELALVQLVRKALDGHDVNLAESPGFVALITPAIAAIVERENQLAQAAINRCDK